jgi:hypothetical protein
VRRGISATIAIVAGLAWAANVMAAASLTSIGALTPAAGGTVESKPYALSPDGNWVVGISNGPNTTATDTISQPIVWSSSSGLVQLPNAYDFATTANGVVILGNGDLGIGGFYYDSATSSMRMHSYTVAPSNLTGGTWVKAPASNLGSVAIGTYNAARAYDDGTGTQWAIAGPRGTTGRGIGSFPVAGLYCDYLTAGQVTKMNTLSRTPIGTYRIVGAGYDLGNAGLRRAVFGSAANSSPQTIIPGGGGYESEAQGITPETTLTAGSGVLVGYDRDMTDSHYEHAFSWVADLTGLPAMTYLGELPGDVASSAFDARLIGGNLIAAGYSSDGTTEKAVVWDNTGTWASGGTPMSVASLLAAGGVDISAWTQLSRVTSMSDDGMTVAGWGVWAEDGSTRGFVATIPEPATLALFALAACVLRRRA